MGIVFYLAFPLMVIGFVLMTFAKVATRAVTGIFSRNAHLTTMRWDPMTAYMKNPDSNKKTDKLTSESASQKTRSEPQQSNRENLS